MYKDYTVFDIETNGLLEEVDMIHCLSYTRVINGVVHKGSIVEYDEIVDFIQEQKVLIGHNIIRYDIPVLKKLLSVKVDAILVDTLALSWYLFPLNLKHGLEEWGVFFGVPKPIIEDWDNLSIEDYLHRCNEDVRINLLLWEKQEAYLKTLYFPDDPIRIVNYLTFKLDCAREQEEVKIKLDVDLCTKTILELTTIKDRIVRELVKSMPKNILYKWANKPKNIYKADGNLTEAGKRWIKVLNDNSLPLDREEKVKVAFGEEDPNPDSPSQIKSWLFSLGWKPQEFKVNIHGKDIPQVRVEVDGEKVLCPSVVLLTKKEPSIEQLKQVTILTHRLGILNGFLEKKDEYGKLKAEIQGLTNTLRYKHCKPLKNTEGSKQLKLLETLKNNDTTTKFEKIIVKVQKIIVTL